jgi:hypothetical protein
MTVNVDFQALLRASTEWADQGDQLAEAAKRLAAASPSSLSEPVRSAAAAFLKHWSAETKTLRETAEGHSEALRGAHDTWQTLDEAEQKRIEGLLPHQPTIRYV